MCYQEKKNGKRNYVFIFFPPHQFPPKMFDRGILRKIYTQNKNAQLIWLLNKQPKDQSECKTFPSNKKGEELHTKSHVLRYSLTFLLLIVVITPLDYRGLIINMFGCQIEYLAQILVKGSRFLMKISLTAAYRSSVWCCPNKEAHRVQRRPGCL